MPRNTHWEEIKRRKKDAYLREQDPRLALNWNTGPWINNGQWQASTTHTTPGSSEWQQSSKEHDSAWATATTREQFEKADQKYYDDNFGKGPWRSAAALAVKVGGGFLRPTTNEDTLSGKVVKRPVSKTPSTTQATPQAAPTGMSGVKRRFAGGETQGPAKMLRGAGFSAGGGGGGAVRGGTQGETPVMPHGPTALIQPDYVTLKHKWSCVQTMQSPVNALVKHEFRVNTPIDPNISATTLTGASNKRFNGFNEQASRYRYYRLLSNHITITFARYNEITTLADEKLHRAPCIIGFIMNPSNRFEVNSSTITSWEQFAGARFVDWKVVSGENPIKTFTFDYVPGQWDTAIDEQHKERLWIPVNEHQNPDDRICLFTQGLHDAVDYAFDVVVTMSAIIQYREWDNQVVERMFLKDDKNNPAVPAEIAAGATTAFDATTDAVPVPDHYSDEEIEEEL